MQTKDFSSLYGRARALRERSKFGAAQAAFLKAAQAADFALDRAEALQGAADCARLTGDFKASLRDYALALRWVPSKELALRADCLSGQALAWRGQGQPLPALQGLRRAQALYQTLRDAQGLAFCHWALGGTLRIAGRLPQALAELKAAERAYARLKDREGASYVDCAPRRREPHARPLD